MRELVTTLGIGFVSGMLSGAFGIGGGIITTPAIKLMLGAPALIAVGTPLPVIFPSALTGAISYARKGIVDVWAGVTCGLAGSATAVLGAWATSAVGGQVVLMATAALILYTAVDMILQVVNPPRVGLDASEEADAFRQDAAARAESTVPLDANAQPGNGGVVLVRPESMFRLVLIGAVTGLYSGFLGLGGGFVLIPMLTRWLGYDIKRAIATSLLAITILAVPGTIAHALLGHIDWHIAALLALGVVPGAILGARFTLGSAERTTRLAFAVLLVVVGLVLVADVLVGR